MEAFARRTEKGGGASFRRDDRSEYGPPRNCATAECEVFEIVLLPAHVEADPDDDDEIQQENCSIDREPGIHVGGHLATDWDGVTQIKLCVSSVLPLG